jgi:4-amino-4-deoxy-L-arabinose transferase-like glycosyltransferase
MDPQKRYKPTWILLFMLGPLAAGLLFLAHQEIQSSFWRQIVEIGIIFITYGLAEVWTRMNNGAFLDNVASKARYEVTEILPPDSLALLPPPYWPLYEDENPSFHLN